MGHIAVQDDLVEQSDDLLPATGLLRPVHFQVLDKRVEGRTDAVISLGFIFPSKKQASREFGIRVQPGPAARGNRGAEDVVTGIVIGSLRVFADEHRGKAPGPANVFRNGGIGQPEIVKERIALTLVVPFRRAVVFVVNLLTEARMDTAHDAIVTKPRDGIPLPQRAVTQFLVATYGVNQPPVVKQFIEVIHVIRVIRCSAALRILFQHQGSRRIDRIDEVTL